MPQMSTQDPEPNLLTGLLIKTKKESADSKRLEEEIKRSEETTKKELEVSNQKLEELKLEFSEVRQLDKSTITLCEMPPPSLQKSSLFYSFLNIQNVFIHRFLKRFNTTNR